MKKSCLLLLLALAACQKAAPPEGDGASAATAAANRAVAQSLPLADQQDFQDARQGLIATPKSLRITRANGELVWDMDAFAFINGAPAPDTVNPSLWRQAQLNNIHGLFKVGEGIYQVRGYDVSNLTLIAGKSGWIIVDPLTTQETAAAAMQLVREHLGDKPVTAFIFTHSHIDHFGGVFGVVTPEQAKSARVIVPEGFMEEATSENVLAGQTMLRRAGYMYGMNLPRSARGHVDTGLGKNPAYASVGILTPTDIIEKTGQTLTVDGVEIVFQNTPAAEAPAEMMFYLPAQKALCGAEVLSRNMHNVYTLRGAKVRDALRWSGYIDEALGLFPQAETYFASHQWPMWGRERVTQFLKTQRDTYKFIHDQTLRLASQGYTPGEIAEAIQMPKSLAQTFSSRGYYGTPKHNARAVYQYYFGWYDAVPAHLDPLPPEDAARRYVEALGGAVQAVAIAQKAYDAGDYRWAAELANHAVFAGGDQTAKELLARAYEQLGYQAESGPWRDVYLSGAQELRSGPNPKPVNLADSLELLRRTPIPRFFDAMAARLDAKAAEDKSLSVNMVFTDLGQSYNLYLENAVLHQRSGAAPGANATLNITHELFLKLMIGAAGLDTLMSDDLKVEGSRLDLVRFFGLFDKPTGNFNIVTP